MKISGDYETREVFINGLKLSPQDSQRVYNHSPDGFSWGYGGSGPAQLALALCLLLRNKNTALRIYQDLKWELIATLPQGDFDINFELERWIVKREKNP